MKLFNLVKNVIPTKTTLMILTFALVIKDELFATDLDNYLCIRNTKLKKGFHVLDLLKHDIDQPQDAADQSDFPNPPETKGKVEEFTLPVHVFQDQFEYYVSGDESRKTLTTIFFGKDGGVVATNGHVLQLEDKCIKVPDDFMLSVRSYLIIRNVIKEFGIEKNIKCRMVYNKAETEEPVRDKKGVTVMVDGKVKTKKVATFTPAHIFFDFPRNAGYLSCRLHEGVYPNYRQIIPLKNKPHSTIDLTSGKHDFQKTLRGAVEIAHCKTRQGTFEKGKLTITNENKFKKPVVMDGIDVSPYRIGLNLAFLGGIFNMLLKDKQKVSILPSANAVSAVLFKNEKRTVLLMPLRLM